MQTDLEEISMEYERTHAAAIITEKRGKNFDKVINGFNITFVPTRNILFNCNRIKSCIYRINCWNIFSQVKEANMSQ
jgi:hypothetical protein